MNRREIAAAVAVGLYILFFSMPPPAIVRGVLDNIVGLGTLFLAAGYVTLYKSKLVGGLLLLALVLSVSRGSREGLDNPAWTSANQTELDQVTATVTQLRGMGLIPTQNEALRNAIARQETLQAQKTAAAAPSGSYRPGAAWSPTLRYSQGDTMTAGGKTYRAKLGNSNIAPSSPQFATYWEDTAGPASAPTTMPPVTGTTPTAGTSTKTPAATPATTTVPAPTTKSTVASCNLENFTTLRRILPQEYAAF